MTPSATSIAVLPFANMSNDIENEYFSDGITEEIINALTKIDNLKVIARTSSFAFKSKQIDVRKVGKQLEVATLLEGSIRKANNRVRITAQLIDTENGAHYWSQNFDRTLEDIFELQDEISLLIANKVRDNFGHFTIQDKLVQQPTNDINAYELFLQGRHYQLQWTPDSLKTAISFYDQAIAKDKNYAKAYYANLQCYGLLMMWGYISHELGMEKAGQNFLLAKEIDTQLPEYPLSFVGKTLWGEWNFKQGYVFIQQVLAINPNHIDGLEAMAELFIACGFFNEAKIYAKKLLELDPLSANHHYTLGHIFYYQEKYKKALASVNTALSIRPELELAKDLQALCFIGLNDRESLVDLHKETSLIDKKLLLFDVVNASKKITKQQVDEWEDLDKDNTMLTPFELFILVNSDYQEEAYALLKKYVTQRRGQLINFKQEPLLKKLQKQKEFENLYQHNFSQEDIRITSKSDKKIKSTVNDDEAEKIKKEVLSYFSEDAPFLDPQLSLTTVADDLELNTNKLSYIINECFNANFNEFVNTYRLQHFKKIAQNPKNKSITLLGLAYDSGFNSKTVFNTFFKKMEGLTPSQWVKSIS